MKSIVLAVIRHYQACISPLLPPACRFHPTCSEYACEAITHWGVGRGMLLMARRLLRCHPFGGFGFDPVPARADEPSLCFVPARLNGSGPRARGRAGISRARGARLGTRRLGAIRSG